MRVDADRVRALPAGEGVAQLRADRRAARVRGVDVEPDAGVGARGRRSRHGVDRGGRGRPDGRDDGARVRRGRARPGAARTTSSTGVVRSSSSSSRAAFAVDECVCSEQTTTRRPGAAARAAASAVTSPVDAVSSRWPCSPSGSPSSSASQASVTSSSSWSAGEARHRIPTWFSVADEELREDPRLGRGRREVREVPRALPVRQPREQHLVEVARARRRTARRSPAGGRAARRGSRPARRGASTGSSRTRSR